MSKPVDLARHIFRCFLDILLPLRERAGRTERRSPHDFTVSPCSHEMRGETITTLLDYQDTKVADLVRALKYEHSSHAARLSAYILSDYLREEIASLRAFSPRKIYVAPVPLHKDRLRSRGFNQVEKILKQFPSDFLDGTVSKLSPHALSRVRNTPQQTKLSRVERIKNVADAFLADDSLHDAHVILIDDVTTTGATITECARALKKVGATTTLIALARA